MQTTAQITPWIYGPSVMVNDSNGEYCGFDIIEPETDQHICTCEHESDAKFIVRAVNSHADLIAACEAALERMEEYARETGSLMFEWECEQAKAAIAKAKGE